MPTPTQSQPPADNAQYTPTPWQIAGPGQVFDAYGNEIAHCKSYGAGIVPSGYVAPWHKADANALFIVRACNNHAALRKVIEESIHPLAQAARILGNTDAGDDALRAYNQACAILIESQIPSA